MKEGEALCSRHDRSNLYIKHNKRYVIMFSVPEDACMLTNLTGLYFTIL